MSMYGDSGIVPSCTPRLGYSKAILDSDLRKLEARSEEAARLLRAGRESALIRKVKEEIEKQRLKFTEATEGAKAEYSALSSRLRKEQEKNREVLKNLEENEFSQLGYSDLKKMKEELELKMGTISDEISTINMKIKALEKENVELELSLCGGSYNYKDSLNLLLYNGLGVDLCEDESGGEYVSCRVYDKSLSSEIKVFPINFRDAESQNSYKLCNKIWDLCSGSLTLMP